MLNTGEVASIPHGSIKLYNHAVVVFGISQQINHFCLIV
jgi:hypothetical protein